MGAFWQPAHAARSYDGAVIIWINGTFGSGKTSTAAELLALVPGARLFDPETVGYMLMPNLADYPVSDFQHWPSWRRLVVATAAELIGFTGSHLIAPQTVLDQPYLQEIIGGLRALDIGVFHVVLDADEVALRSRIEGSDEATQWRLDHLAPYLAARSWMIEDADLVVDTTAVRPAQSAQLIVGRLSEIEAFAPSPVG
jgi:hypothetical protein